MSNGPIVAVRRPVRHDVERPAHHRDHHRHVVGVGEVVHADVRVVRRDRRSRGRSRPRCGAARDWRARASLSASGASRLDASSKYSSGRRAGTSRQMSGCTHSEEADLRVVGVMVAEAGGEPGARLVERRGHEAASGRRPLGDAPLGLLLQRLAARAGMSASSRGIRGQRPGGSAQGVGAKRDADLVHRDADAGRGEEEGDLDVVLQVLADVRRIDPTRDARGLELVARADARQQQQVRRPDRPAAQHDLLGQRAPSRCPRLRCGTRRRVAAMRPGAPSRTTRVTWAPVMIVRFGRSFGVALEERVIGARPLARPGGGLEERHDTAGPPRSRPL